MHRVLVLLSLIPEGPVASLLAIILHVFTATT